MAEQRKINTSPLVKSLTNMDHEIKAILEDTTMPPDRKIQLYDSIMNRYRNILVSTGPKHPYERKENERNGPPLRHPLERPFSHHPTPRKRKRKKKKKKDRCYYPLHPRTHRCNFHHPLRPHPSYHPITEKKKREEDFCQVL